jgi:hypothetical protein
MKIIACSLTLLLCIDTAQAQMAQHVPDHPVARAAMESAPERFMSVTAENGQEWLEQCEWPAQKSDSMARIAACLSFLQGAKAVAVRRNPEENCPVDFSAQSRGTLLTTTYQIARRYPRMQIGKIFRIAFDSVGANAC